jgi:hypothetical protein
VKTAKNIERSKQLKKDIMALINPYIKVEMPIAYSPWAIISECLQTNLEFNGW